MDVVSYFIGPLQRRQRLRSLLAETGETNGMPEALQDMEIEEEEDVQQETFFTEGSEALKEARIQFAHYSVKR